MKILTLNDTHCGAISGLTPPAHWSNDAEIASVQKVHWDFFVAKLAEIGPIDVLVLVGDMIDGKAVKAGGRDLSTADRLAQVKIAKEVVEAVAAPKVYVVTGTPYHVGVGEDWEEVLAELIDAKAVAPRIELEHDGFVLAFRHKIGRSGVPYGKATAPLRALTWNRLNAARGLEPKANICAFGHVHYHLFAGDARATAMTLPAMQLRTAFGDAEIDGDFDVGMVVFDIAGGSLTWKAHLLDLSFIARRAFKL